MNDNNFNKMTSFIDELFSGSEVNATLQLFRQWIFTLGTSELENLVDEFDFSNLFQYLFKEKTNDINVVLEIFHKTVSVIPVGSRIPRLQSLFQYGLQYGTLQVKESLLKQLEICIEDNEALDQLSKNRELMVSIASLIGDSSLSVASCCANILTNFGGRGDMIELLFSPTINKIMREMMSECVIIKFRVYQIVMKLSSLSSRNLDLIAKNGYFESLLSDINSTDELSVLNCLEVLKELSVTNHGLEFLSNLGAMSAIAAMTLWTSDPLARSLLLPGLLKFFMNIGHKNPGYLFENHIRIVHLHFSLLKDPDPVLMCSAVDGIGLLGCSLHGKVLLNSDGKMPCALKHFGIILKTYSPEVKYNVLQALARLLRIKDHEKFLNPEFHEVLCSWFRLVSEDTEVIFKMCRQPFEELRYGALCVISAVVTYEWGQKILETIPGFIEFVLDRSTENTARGKEIKFKIVQTLLETVSINSIFDTETIDKLQEYCQKGPFYVSAITTVAVEDPV